MICFLQIFDIKKKKTLKKTKHYYTSIFLFTPFKITERDRFPCVFHLMATILRAAGYSNSCVIQGRESLCLWNPKSFHSNCNNYVINKKVQYKLDGKS